MRYLWHWRHESFRPGADRWSRSDPPQRRSRSGPRRDSSLISEVTRSARMGHEEWPANLLAYDAEARTNEFTPPGSAIALARRCSRKRARFCRSETLPGLKAPRPQRQSDDSGRVASTAPPLDLTFNGGAQFQAKWKGAAFSTAQDGTVKTSLPSRPFRSATFTSDIGALHQPEKNQVHTCPARAQPV